MKLRLFVLVTVVSALATTACADSPTASKPTLRTAGKVMLAEGDTISRGGGSFGTGH